LWLGLISFLIRPKQKPQQHKTESVVHIEQSKLRKGSFYPIPKYNLKIPRTSKTKYEK